VTQAVRAAPARPSAEPGLWRNGDFVRLWSAQTISLFGSQVTEFALPLVAIITLAASATEAGLVATARFLPFLLLTIFMGVLVDRSRRLPILVTTNAGRAVLLGLIPLLALVGGLGIPVLLVIAFAVGVLTVAFDLAYLSYLPSLVDRRLLVKANGALETSYSTAEFGGPALGGVLVQVFSAPLAILVDAISYVASAALLRTIRTRETRPEPAESGRVLADIREGLAFVFRNRYLRALATQAAVWNLFNQVFLLGVMLYTLRELDLSPFFLGLFFSVGSAGGVVGGLMAERWTRRFGFGVGLLTAMTIDSLAPALVPLAGGPEPLVLATMLVAAFLWGWGLIVSNVNVVTLRQSVTPNRLLGRMTASYRLLSWGGIPIGAATGGVLADWIGFRAALVVAAIGMALSMLAILLSPLPRLREPPQAEPAAA
jgi:MFS family permease